MYDFVSLDTKQNQWPMTVRKRGGSEEDVFFHTGHKDDEETLMWRNQKTGKRVPDLDALLTILYFSASA